MSMIKTSSPEINLLNESVTYAIKWSSRGLIGDDLKQFVKRAGVKASDVIKKMSFDKGEIPIHLLALGAFEVIGQNRNADGFTIDTCRKYHPTFKKYAKWYRNHKNQDKSKSYGIIKESLYNEEMGRIELIVGLNGTKEAASRNKGLVADKEMQKLASKDDEIAVSMSCVLDPKTPVLTSIGYKEIIDVNVGDLVYTHKGNWKKVTKLNRRKYSGEVVTIKVQGLPIELNLTAEHPMYGAVLQEYVTTGVNGSRIQSLARWADNIASGVDKLDWLHATHLSKWDRIACPVVKSFPDKLDIDDKDFCEILGIYTAEGSISYCKDNPNHVVFSVNVNDWAVEGIPSLLRKICPDVKCSFRTAHNSKFALHIGVNSAELARWILKLVGHGCRRKRIPLELFNSSAECKFAFMGRWCDGDGFCDKKGVHWSSVNLPLILQGRDLLLSEGIPSSIYKIDHTKCATSGMVNSSIEYTLNVSNIDAKVLTNFSKKVSESTFINNSVRSKPACLIAISPNNEYVYRVKEVVKKDVVDSQTYNLEVEDDESYTIYGMSSHNCKVSHDICSLCHNKAKTRNDYCLGADEGGHCKEGAGCKNRLGKVFEDGSVLYVDNPEPLWFDISSVFRPADRIAYVTGRLDKKASDNRFIGSAELAESLNVSAPFEVETANITNTDIKNHLKIAKLLSRLETNPNRLSYIPYITTKLAAITSVNKTNKDISMSLKALAQNKIAMSLTDFVEFVSNYPRNKAIKLASEIQPLLPNIFTTMCKDMDKLAEDLKNNPFKPSICEPNSNIKYWANNQRTNASLENKCVEKRAYAQIINDNPITFNSNSNVNPMSEAHNNLAYAYGLYKLAFLHEIKDSDPDFMLTADLIIHQNYII